MKLLANENIPQSVVRGLRERGHDVAAIVERTPGMRDSEVLTMANAEERPLLTFDRDYGELIFVRRMPCPAGRLYLRLIPSSPQQVLERLMSLPEGKETELAGKFVVADEEGVRLRPLPRQTPSPSGHGSK
ncbi:MAG: DUF5615 family PIN-like protein [Betaproteobacteria bacterium]|nr:DUF5615 family PIN-like protein [Betaproteobacteria bacterium]